MTGGGDFARCLRALGAEIEQRGHRRVQAAARATLRALIETTPVASGLTRANWQVGRGAPARGLGAEPDITGAATLAAGEAEIAAARPGETIYISNNRPGVARLNDGSSRQAPAGFVERALESGRLAARGGEGGPRR